MKKILLSLAFLSLSSYAFTQKIKDFSKIPSQVAQSKQELNFKFADSLAQEYINGYLLQLKPKDLMKKENLLFISENLNGTKNKAFKFFMKEQQKINAILGADKAEYAIRSTIAKEYTPQEGEWLTKKPNWDLLQKQVSAKFGVIGAEMIYGKRMNYYSKIMDWANYGKYYLLYFEKALRRPEFNINHMSYYLVLYVSDQKVLKFAAEIVMKYAMEEWYQNNYAAWDTYAGLLYKIGKKEEAIDWEEKGLKAVKGGPNEKSFVDVLEKMKKGLPIWSTTPSNN
nr:hypothetical protein [Pedobacter panaciterrae]